MTADLLGDLGELEDVVARLLRNRCDAEALHRLISEGRDVDQALRADLVKLGVFGLAVTEEQGGQGGDYLDLAHVLRVVGASLAPVGLFATSWALAIVAQLGAKGGDLDRLISGIALAAVGSTTVGLNEFNGGHQAFGAVDLVVDGTAADLLVVRGETPSADTAIAVIDLGDRGVRTTRREGLDLTRGLASIELDAAPAVVIGLGAEAAQAWERGNVVARILLAAEQIGGAAACLTQATGYAKIREQFGHPIGSYQAIKHKCADMLVGIQNGRSITDAAARAIDSGDWNEAELLAAAAKGYCSEVFVRAAQENLQIHGGIGFTFDNVAHLYLRRAKATEVLLDSPVQCREQVAATYLRQERGPCAS